MSLHALARADRRVIAEDHAWVVLRAHLDARHYAPCIAAVPHLRVPETLHVDADLVAAAALVVAQTFGLLVEQRDAAAVALVRAGLDGAAESALARAAPDAVLAWCTAAGEWCERNGLDHEFSLLAPRAAIADADASPWARVHWRIASAWHHEAFGRREAVAAFLADAKAVAEAAGDVGLQVVVWLKQARLSLWRSAPEAALLLAQQAGAHADERHSPLWLADAADVASRVALIRGDMHGALHQARRTRGLAALAAAPPSYTFTYRVNEAYALLGLGAWDEALAVARELAQLPLPLRLAGRMGALADLVALIRDERQETWSDTQVLALRAVMRRLRELDWPGVLSLLPDVVARLWARALDAGIETDWIRASVISRDLAAPESSWPTHWPWAVRVSVLGPFACVVDGRDLASTPGKAAARPLALLRRIAAEGGFDGIASHTVASGLWPGEDREGRDKALETTLARLRRLLGHADAVLLHERRLRLNQRRVWLDSAALARTLDACGHADEPPWSDAFALWRGPPLADGPELPWLVAWRERQRLRMAAALLAAAAQPGHRARCMRAMAADPGLAAQL